MRLLKIMVITLVLSGVSVLSASCASNSTPAPEGRVVTVQPGNLKTDITGVGNLALSQKVDLAFDIPSSFSIVSKPITVEEVLVKAGDSVQEGQLLAKLDISGWDDQITTLEDAITTAERNVTAKERAVTQAELTVLQRQSALNSAKLSLENTEETSTDPLQIQIAKLNLEIAKGNLEAAQTAVEDAQTAVEDAQKAVEDAQKNLANAQGASPEIKAPFTGFITQVNVSGGDEVKKGTIAMTIADPTKFEAQIMVSEIDILKVKLGGDASVQVQAIPGVSFPATVTDIAPTATIQSSVVNYQVTVELTSLQPISTQRQSRTAATGNVTRGAFSGRSGQGFSSGNLTQEQINQMIQQRQQAKAGQPEGQSTQAPTAPNGNAQLAEGMTITVIITTAERDNVLLVPIQAIISKGGETFVQVLNNGVTEERPVQTGISNYQYVEITSGLSEGEQVVIPQGATAATTSTQQQGQMPPQGGTFIPGLGRVR